MTIDKKSSSPSTEGFSLISSQKLLALYSAMLLCRRIGESSRVRLKQGRPAGSLASILGHEAAAVGTAIDLLPADTVAPARWPDAVLKAINPSVSVCSGILPATRSAVANRALTNRESLSVTVLFSDSKRAAKASWQKALDLAAAQNLPALFVSLNQEGDRQRPAEALAVRGKKKGCAFPSICVDGNDVVAVYRVASEAIAHARKGHGPTLIECPLAHPCDPIKNMEKYLIRKGLVEEQLRASRAF
jgi:TPP-dependent pyruvate/acetoin dehydrogenase alpha subunit